MEIDNGPEIDISEGTGLDAAPKENAPFKAYMERVTKAAKENRIEEYYQNEKSKLEENLKLWVGDSYKEPADSVRRDISALEDAYRIVKKDVNNKNIVKICPKCGIEYENSAKFCGKCGNELVLMQCPCGEVFLKKEDGSFDKFCMKCGQMNPLEQAKQALAEKVRKKAEETRIAEGKSQKQENEQQQLEAAYSYFISSGGMPAGEPAEYSGISDIKYGTGPETSTKGNIYKIADKICPKCGKGYDSKNMFCLEDGKELIEIWKCHNCGEDLKNVHGYSCINHCPDCGKPVAAMQRKALDSIKKSGRNSLKRICSNEKCGTVYENSAKFCGKCGRLVVAMQCACGEIFRQKKDGSFDKYCPKCGKINPLEEHKRQREVLKKEQEEAIKERKRKELINGLKTGDIIKFGSYPYEADGTEKPIEWIILEKYSDDTALLLSRYGLDAVRFAGSSNNWEKSEIRHWLNNEFYNKAFDEKERINIIESSIECEKRVFFVNRTYTVNDKIFLLSIEEVEKYFNSYKDRICLPTPYAKTNVYTNADYGGSCWWWLRSPGYDKGYAAAVPDAGGVSDDNFAVRMAFKINLKNL